MITLHQSANYAAAGNTQQTQITEQTGATWIATPTGQQGDRALWVFIHTYSSPSTAKPNTIGFYAPNIRAACNALNN